MIRLTLIPILVLLSATFVVEGLGQLNTPPRPTPEVQLRFSRQGVAVMCECMRKRGHTPEWASGKVHVSVLINRNNPGPLNYKYTVNGGRVIGQGPNVTWDFNDGYAPGKYSMTVAVDDGLGIFSGSVTESMTFAEADCHCPCECPSMSVISHHSQVKRGDELDFEARIAGGTAKKINYNWRVDNGVILTGQGTPFIEVKASSERNAKDVTATLEVGLDYDCGCSKVADQAVPIGPRSIPKTYPVTLTWLVLDENTVTLACPSSHGVPTPDSIVSKDSVVDVRPFATSHSIHDELNYSYSVTGGTIIGSGSNVKWDLTGSGPGTYSIRAVVADSRESTAEKTETVTIENESCREILDCPALSTSIVSGNALSGDFIVEGTASQKDFLNTASRWTAEGAEIIAGQGSRSVRLRPTSRNILVPGPLVTFSLDLPSEYAGCGSSPPMRLWTPDPK